MSLLHSNIFVPQRCKPIRQLFEICGSTLFLMNLSIAATAQASTNVNTGSGTTEAASRPQPTVKRKPSAASPKSTSTGTSGKNKKVASTTARKPSDSGWRIPEKPAQLFADDIEAYVHNVAAYAGPRQFVKWVDMAAESQRAGKPAAYEQQRAIGVILGGVMGSAVGMLGGDPMRDMARMSQQGQRLGEGLGTVNAYPMENQQLSMGVMSFELKHKQQLAKLTILLSNCVDTGTELSDCLHQQPVSSELDAIQTFNFATCYRLAELPANGGQTLSREYCAVNRGQ